MKKTLGVGVIGLGMGRGHVRNFQAVPQTKVLAVADVDAQRLAVAKNELQVPDQYTDYKKMLERDDIDIVVVATPNRWHHPMAIAALNAGKHVVCEKPMAMNAKEAQEMAAAAKRAHKKFMLGYSYRYRQGARVMRQIVDDGLLGDVYYAKSSWMRAAGVPKGNKSWFINKKLAGGGPMIDLGVHMLDLAMWYLGYPEPVAVSASTYSDVLSRKLGFEGDVEELATAFIRLSTGATLLLEASWASHTRDSDNQRLDLMGDKGGAQWQSINYADAEVSYFNSFGRPPLNWKVRGSKPESLQAYFTRCVLQNLTPDGNEDMGVKVMKILDAVYKSAKTGKEVRITNK